MRYENWYSLYGGNGFVYFRNLLFYRSREYKENNYARYRRNCGTESRRSFYRVLFRSTRVRYVAHRKAVLFDEKLSFVFRPEKPTFPDSISLKGKIFTYAGSIEESPFGGDDKVVLLFDCEGHKFRYETGKTREEIGRLKYTPLIPPFIDIDDLNMARSLLKDRVLYIKTPMWYNEKSEAIEGRKLIPVRVVDIRPGNNVLPVEVWFEDDKGNQAGVFMSLLSSSRSQYITFDRLFSFENPRLQYKEIQDDAWEQITLGKVKTGMTKAECKLSLGNPNEVKKIPTYSGLREQWIYNSGAYLFFVDDLLADYRL